mmetsp:Transcript_5238/g.12617  ORF Transcript_5238/g.12617 Transcript_5238/m.12617 type:complete len:459 (-) Transcript_5238:262-1638(-)
MPFSELQRVAIAGTGFLADAYDLYIIGQVQTVLFSEYPVDENDQEHFKSLLSSAALVGAIFGQLIFGSLADWLGRKVIFVVTGSTIVLGSILSASAQASLFGSDERQIFYQIALGRMILGFGIGGEYPLSATIASESSTARRRGTLMALVFSMQGIGYLLSATVMLALAYANASNQVTWRFALAFGGVVPLFSLYFRVKMEENAAFQEVQQARSAAGATAVTQAASAWKYRWHILGTALNWAVFDIVFYANGLFNEDVTASLQHGSGMKASMLRTFIIVIIQLPGYMAAVLTINRIGRKNMQLMGFIAMFALFLVIGISYPSLKQHPALFLTLYGLTFFCSNWGPNTTTYIIPGEIYPPQIKATSHGLSAAAGKTGATVGAATFQLFQPKKSEAGLQLAMLACGACAALGVLLTMFLTPRYEAEDLEKRDDGETVGFVPLPWQRVSVDRRSLVLSTSA